MQTLMGLNSYAEAGQCSRLDQEEAEQDAQIDELVDEYISKKQAGLITKANYVFTYLLDDILKMKAERRPAEFMKQFIKGEWENFCYEIACESVLG